MTYNVFGGTLNLAQPQPLPSLTRDIIDSVKCPCNIFVIVSL